MFAQRHIHHGFNAFFCVAPKHTVRQRLRCPRQRLRSASTGTVLQPTETTTCIAVGSNSGHSTSLASYPLLGSRGVPSSALSNRMHQWSRMWFEAMVQTVVKQLDGSPFLLKVTSRPFLRIQLIRLGDCEFEQGWDHIQQQHLSDITAGQADDAVILVHPVASQQQPCVVKQVQRHACPNCPHGQAGCSYDQAEDLEMMAGKFGDCCSSHKQQPQRQQAYSSSGGTSSESHVCYYGLVVQCKDAADPLQGCYLLKTMQVKQHHGGGSGCQCTHYSLNRVCKGPSLQQQFQDAWLV